MTVIDNAVVRFDLSGPIANNGDTWALAYGGNTSTKLIAGAVSVQAVADLFVGDIAGQAGFTAFRLAGTDDLVIVRFSSSSFSTSLNVARDSARGTAVVVGTPHLDWVQVATPDPALTVESTTPKVNEGDIWTINVAGKVFTVTIGSAANEHSIGYVTQAAARSNRRLQRI